MKQRALYVAMLIGGIVGLVPSFWLTIDKLQLLENGDKILSCDLNSVFSCTSVLNAWQDNLFGFPNSLLCMVFFTIFGVIGLVGLSGGTLPRKLRLGIHALALFVLGFGLWFLTQSIYVINALCILCLFCFSGLLLINWGWLRLNAKDLPIGKDGRAFVQGMIEKGADTFIWILLALLLTFAMIGKFA